MFWKNFWQRAGTQPSVQQWKAAELIAQEYTALDRVAQRSHLQELMNRLVAAPSDNIVHHMFTVSEYVRVLCIHSGMDPQTVQDYADAALLHDMGKLCLPKNILEKIGKLTREEFTVIRLHNRLGYDLLHQEGNAFRELAAQVALQHHEHYAGTGYLGHHGDNICYAAQLTSVADVFSALTAKRSYKRQWTFDEAFDYIAARSGKDFSPAAVRLFCDSRAELLEAYQKYQTVMDEAQM